MNPDEAKEWLPVLRDYATFFTGLGLIIGGFVDGNGTLIAVGSSLSGLGVIHYIIALFTREG